MQSEALDAFTAAIASLSDGFDTRGLFPRVEALAISRPYWWGATYCACWLFDSMDHANSLITAARIASARGMT